MREGEIAALRALADAGEASLGGEIAMARALAARLAEAANNATDLDEMIQSAVAFSSIACRIASLVKLEKFIMGDSQTSITDAIIEALQAVNHEMGMV